MVMYTRADYMAERCTHRQYYAQFVTPEVFTFVSRTFGYNRLQEALKEDPALNSISLQSWDRVYMPRIQKIKALMKEAGDIYSEAGKVCILKEAAMQICEG